MTSLLHIKRYDLNLGLNTWVLSLCGVSFRQFLMKLPPMGVRCVLRNVCCLMTVIIFVIFDVWILTFLFGSNTTLQSYVGKLITDYSTYKRILTMDDNPLVFRSGHSIFPNLECSTKNCMFTKFSPGLDPLDYHAILFTNCKMKPQLRNLSQLYIYTSVSTPEQKPACDTCHEGFYNWTFTYRLESNIVWLYFVVKNGLGQVVAPSENVVWAKNKEPLRPAVWSVLAEKSKAVAWITNKCENLQTDYLAELQKYLVENGMSIDLYGKCGKKTCPDEDCNAMLRRDYVFYIAFEDSLFTDFVTEKVLRGYDNFAVPIVLGGADYGRFLPPGSYINAAFYHPNDLADLMQQIFSNQSLLHSYFHWTNLYTIESTENSKYHPLCYLCDDLHYKVIKPGKAMPKKNFRIWHNDLDGMRWCLKDYMKEQLAMKIYVNNEGTEFNIF